MEDDENRKMLLQEYQQDYIEREPREEHTDLVKLRAIYDSKIYDVKHFTNDKAKQRRYGTWGNCMESYIINNNSGGSHEYKKARTFVDKDIFGRDYSAHSVQILPGDIRRSITEDYDDLDINASHDTSIDVVCRMCDVETPPIIKEYIKNKDPTRKRISKETNLSVKEVKLIINKLKYGGELYGERSILNGPNEWLEEYQSAIKRVVDTIVPMFPEDLEIAKENHKRKKKPKHKDPRYGAFSYI